MLEKYNNIIFSVFYNAIMRYPEKYIKEIIKQSNKYSVKLLASEYGCSKESIYRWKTTYPKLHSSNTNKIIPVSGYLKRRFGHLNENKKEKLMLTSEALYSLSHFVDADKLSRMIQKCVGKNITITDGTANVGGNTISFCKHFNQVNSIELDCTNFKALKNNISVYGFQNVNLLNKDSTKQLFCKDFKQDVLFLDPPWGGIDYKKHKTLDLFLGKQNITYLVRKVFQKTKTKIIILKVPNNFNSKEFFKKIKQKHKIHQFKKYKIIFLFSSLL